MNIKYCPKKTNPAKLNQIFKTKDFPILYAYQSINELFDYWEYAISIPKYSDNYNIDKKFTEIKKFMSICY